MPMVLPSSRCRNSSHPINSRPDIITATQKEANPHLALHEALTAVTRQIRERREKLKKRWEQPGNLPVEQEITEVMTAEAGSLSVATKEHKP